MIIRRVGGFSGGFQSVYPPAYNDTYVKSTTKWSTKYWPYYATDPSRSLIGNSDLAAWISADGHYVNQRFHIDLGLKEIISRIYYENFHSSGSITGAGVKNFILQGSNNSTAFSTLTYITDTNWTEIMTGQFDQHVASDQTDPKYILVPLHSPYRYYALKIANGWNTTGGVGFRRFELQKMI